MNPSSLNILNNSSKYSSEFRAKDHTSIFDTIRDDAKTFPKGALNLLKNMGLLQKPLPKTFSQEFEDNPISTQSLLELLFEVGKGDLSVCRIWEGHINALLLINEYGTELQKQTYFKEVLEGKIFGIWNTELPEEALKLCRSADKMTLHGAKTFCSGATDIDRPIITAATDKGVQMIVLELDDKKTWTPDWTFWNPSGMKASVSCRFDFTDTTVLTSQLLGANNDYYKEPYFSWGAVRFASVQLGGARKIFDVMAHHLKTFKRTEDPYQKMRLGKIAVLMETAELWIKKASVLNDNLPKYSSDYSINFAHMMRTVTLDICEQTMRLAERSVGLLGTLQTHPMEKSIRDLRVYIKQAGPDRTLAAIGTYAVNN